MDEENQKQNNQKDRKGDNSKKEDKNRLKEKLEKTLRELKKCQKEREQYLKGWQRQRADFINYKKQEVERVEEMRLKIEKEYLLKILELTDDIRRALKNVPKDLKNNDWVKGIEGIERRFQKFLQDQGVRELKGEGEQFNPQFHEAVAQVQAKDYKEGQIVEVLQKGYLIKGRLLRPALVKVAK